MITVSRESQGAAWRPFVGAFLAAMLAVGAALYGFVLALDPYGLRTGPGRAPTPLMDLNQRYMFPQLVRSGHFDGAVFGTSTIRLLDPQQLGRVFGAGVANLGMNAGTPWEQSRLADLFLRNVPAPKLVVIGLDRTWCAPDADAPDKRLTFRSFPPWLYEDAPLRAAPELINLRSLEIAGRVALHRLGLMKERIRGDGYEVFTPPEASYDLPRARQHIWSGTKGHIEPQSPPVTLDARDKAALRFPALGWLAEIVDRLPASTRLLLVFPPVHIAAQPTPGSREAAVEAACKERAAAIGARRAATTVDFRIASPITAEDANYWDNLHFRLPIADRIVADLKAATSGQDSADGSYRVLSGKPASAP